jgi:hypothetical protein
VPRDPASKRPTPARVPSIAELVRNLAPFMGPDFALQPRGRGQPKKLPGYSPKDYDQMLRLLQEVAAIRRECGRVKHEMIAHKLGMTLGTFRRRYGEAKKVIKVIMQLK